MTFRRFFLTQGGTSRVLLPEKPQKKPTKNKQQNTTPPKTRATPKLRPPQTNTSVACLAME